MFIIYVNNMKKRAKNKIFRKIYSILFAVIQHFKAYLSDINISARS